MKLPGLVMRVQPCEFTSNGGKDSPFPVGEKGISLFFMKLLTIVHP